MKFKKLNLENSKIDSFDHDIDLKPSVNIDHLYFLFTNYKKKSRFRNASSKTRAEVTGTTAKPFKQKGTGRARRGTVKSPLLVGGGAAFGPRIHQKSFKLNKKILSSIISNILLKDNVYIVDTNKTPDNTKAFNSVLKDSGLSKGRITLLLTPQDSTLIRIANNISNVDIQLINTVDIHPLLTSSNIIISNSVLTNLVREKR